MELWHWTIEWLEVGLRAGRSPNNKKLDITVYSLDLESRSSTKTQGLLWEGTTTNVTYTLIIDQISHSPTPFWKWLLERMWTKTLCPAVTCIQQSSISMVVDAHPCTGKHCASFGVLNNNLVFEQWFTNCYGIHGRVEKCCFYDPVDLLTILFDL